VKRPEEEEGKKHLHVASLEKKGERGLSYQGERRGKVERGEEEKEAISRPLEWRCRTREKKEEK